MTHTLAGVLFDLDGTLVDTVDDLASALNHLLNDYHRPPLANEDIRPHVSGGIAALLKLAFAIDDSMDDYINKAKQLENYYQQYMLKQSKLFVGIKQVLEYLQQQRIPWGIVTNKRTRFAEPLSKHLALIPATQICVAGDTLAVSKPDPAPLYFACQQLKIEATTCLYVGDAERDIIAGQRAGMRTVAALYGYIATDIDPYSWQADHYIDRPDELINLFKQVLY